MVCRGSRAARRRSIQPMTSSTASEPSVRSSGRWMAKPSRRTFSMAAWSWGSSCSLTPCRFIEDMTSMTTRAPTSPYTPSTDDTERMTRSGRGTGSSARR